jgi:tetratricopeptide (TPR) repeat protein
MQVMETTMRVFGEEHRSTLSSLSNLGIVLTSQGKLEEAEAMHRRALDGYEKVLGSEHPDTLSSVDHLAYFLRKQHRYEDALALYKRAISGY